MPTSAGPRARRLFPNAGQGHMTTKINATEFLKGMFAHTTKPIYTCSFPNERLDETQVSERHVITRMPSQIESFVKKWDRDGRGTFFCVATIDDKRKKENTRETIILHADIDFKNVDMLGDDPLKEVIKQLARLKLQPSAVVFSGNGVHVYWLLSEPLDTQGHMEAIELVLRQLADLLAGDLSVCEVSRVMRMPGTFNTKDGARKEVEVLAFNPERRYELDDIEEWLAETSPIMLRKVRPAAVAAGDGEQAGESYFERYGREHGIKAPIDVEARLNAMMYMGGGDSSIHQTQIAVTASLLNAGTPKDEVVAYVLAATKRCASDYGSRWNWRREERNIVKMCDDWIKKHPPQKKPAATIATTNDDVKQVDDAPTTAPTKPTPPKKSAAGGNVIPLVPKAVTSNKKSEQHVTVGQAVMAQIRDNGEQLIRTPDGAWFFSGGVWEMMNETGWLEIRIESACVGFGFISNTKLVNETRNYIMRRPELWRDDDLPWDQHGKVPVRNGLVDPLTGELEPARPDHFCTWRIDVVYDPAAKCPWWEMMIADVFGDKDTIEQRALVRVIQEVLGAALVDRKPRQLSKALILWGVSNQGKSGLIEVFTGLFGNNPIGVSIGSVETPHGLMPFTQRLPWVLHEAFGGQWHFSSTIKAIITQEPVLINIKNGPMLTQVVRAPIFWATNFQPQFKEATRAIINRMIVIECSRVFEDTNPVGVALEAKRRKLSKPSDVVIGSGDKPGELQGVLNWALAGLRRALERGTIELTDSINETAEAIRRDSNLVAGFLDDCIEYDPLARLKVADFCLAHSLWWLELKGEDRRLPTNEAIGKAIKAIGDGRIGMDPKEMRDTTSRYYCGVALNRAGLRYHKAAYESRTFEGKIATATNPERDVNGTIPPSWDAKKSIIAMRDRHAKTAPQIRPEYEGEE